MSQIVSELPHGPWSMALAPWSQLPAPTTHNVLQSHFTFTTWPKSPMDGRYVTRGTRRFAGLFAKLRGRSADVSQVSYRALRTYHSSHTFHSQRFAAFRRRFASITRHTSRQLSHTFRARFVVFRGRFASVALDTSMQLRCHNVGISTRRMTVSKY